MVIMFDLTYLEWRT